MKKTKILYIVIAVLLVVFCARNQILKFIVGITLNNYTSSRYSIECKVDSIESEGFNNKLIYAHDKNGVKFAAKSNLLGMITEESYAHYYYSSTGDEEINEIVSSAYQGDFRVVKNLFHDRELDYYLLNIYDIKTYKDYVAIMEDEFQYYLVYIKEKPSKKDVELILDALEAASLDDNISVIINFAPEEIYDLHENLSAYLGYTESEFSKYCDATDDMPALRYYLRMPYKIAVYNFGGSTEILKDWE